MAWLGITINLNVKICHIFRYFDDFASYRRSCVPSFGEIETKSRIVDENVA
jgi:hypothetical protein